MYKQMLVASKTLEYLAWKAMKWRCNPRNLYNRKNYLDKGITGT